MRRFNLAAVSILFTAIFAVSALAQAPAQPLSRARRLPVGWTGVEAGTLNIRTAQFGTVARSRVDVRLY